MLLSWNRLVRGGLCLAVAVAPLVVASPAQAATPTIVNAANGQWLETGAISDRGSTSSDVTVTLLVSHDPGKSVTGIKVDDDYDGTDNTTSKTTKVTTLQQPTIVNGYDYSRITYTYNAPTSNSGVNCNVITGGTQRSTRPIRIRAVMNDGSETATANSSVEMIRYDCTQRDDFPVLTSRSQSATSINPGDPVTFTFTADDSDSSLTTNQTFGGVRYRLRRLSDNTTTTPVVQCYGDSDNTEQNLNVTFPDRGHWVVEAELLNSNDGCAPNPASGAWWRLGSVDVNSPAASSPNVSLSIPRPSLNGNAVVTATVDDSADAGQGGVAQDLEWDLDENTANGVGGFEDVSLGSVATGLTSTQRTRTINTTGKSPGLHTVRARVGDNGALGGADTARRTKTVSATYLVDTPPVAYAQTVITRMHTPTPISLIGWDVDGDALGYLVHTPPTNGSLTGVGANRSFTPDPDFVGSDSLTFAVSDGYGGTSAPATVTINVAPYTALATSPDHLSTSTASFSLSSPAAGATFECRLDGGTYSACSATPIYTDLAQGTHTFSARASASGVTDPFGVGTTFTVDVTGSLALLEQGLSSCTGPTTFTLGDDFTGPDTDLNASCAATIDLNGHDLTVHGIAVGSGASLDVIDSTASAGTVTTDGADVSADGPLTVDVPLVLADGDLAVSGGDVDHPGVVVATNGTIGRSSGSGAAIAGTGVVRNGGTITVPTVGVTAKVTGRHHTVTFDTQGGSAAPDPVTVFATTFTAGARDFPADPTKRGYTFLGWNTAADGSGDPVTASSELPGSSTDGTPVETTAYAQWTQLTVSVPTPTIANTTSAARGTSAPAGGDLLQAAVGATDPSGATPSFQWRRTLYGETNDIDGATASSYRMDGNDLGAKVSVRVTATDPPYAAGQASSARTGTVVLGTQSSTPTPTISPDPKVGVELQVVPGPWDEGVQLSYQWYVNDFPVSTLDHYTPPKDDAGETIRVEVEGIKSGFQAVLTSSAEATVADGDLASTPTPTISPSPKVDVQLSVVPGAWDDGVDLTYQWYVDGTPVSTLDHYTPAPADHDKSIGVEVTGSKTGYSAVTMPSATGTVAKGDLVTAAPTPTISGTPKVGATLTAVPGSWGSGVDLDYQWLVGGLPVLGATRTTYVPVAGDAGRTVAVRVTGTRIGYTPVIRTGAPVGPVLTDPVVAATPVAAPRPLLLGRPQPRYRLRVAPGVWNGTVSVQWYRGADPITAAIGLRYRVKQKDLHRRVSAHVTYTSADGTSVTVVRSAKVWTYAPPRNPMFLGVRGGGWG